MKLEIKVPSVGESVSSADIESWERSTGDPVKKGDIVAILGTDKASMEIPAPGSGQLNIVQSQGKSVSIGEVIGFIDTHSVSKENTPIKKNTADPEKHIISSNIRPMEQPVSDLKNNKMPSSPAPQVAKEALSPAVRRLVESHKLKPSNLQGTGKGGRLTKADILKVLNEKETLIQPPPTTPLIEKSPSLREGQRREAMTRLRKTTAQRLVHSQHTTATLSTFNEVDMSRIIEIRKNYQESFVKKHGCKLGFMSFFVKAVVAGLKECPRLNAFIDGEDIVFNDHQHIGVAVSAGAGLVVPVIFQAESLSLADIEKRIIKLRDKALSRKLSPSDLLGGTFTISNGGVFGSLLSTPILNPPQSGILGMHKIEPRPVARKGQVEISQMMYVALSYDHRIVDGKEAVGFLVKVKEVLEEPARLLVDV